MIDITLYRYVDGQYEDGVALVLKTFNVIRKTDKTYFYKRNSWEQKIRQVRIGAVRSFAHDTEEAAFKSYIERKRKQIWHAKVAMQTATLAIDVAGSHRDKLKFKYGLLSSVMGVPEFYNNLVFD